VCTGELVQTQWRFAEDLRLEEYLDIIRMKTGALFAVSTELGALLNDSTPAVVKSLRDFGGELGVAYQIYDDCVDILGDEPHAGKSLGTDMKKGKLTLPVLLLLEHENVPARRELREMIFRSNPEDRRRVISLVMGNGVLPETLAAIQRHIAQAEANLAVLPRNPCADLLRTLAVYLSRQSSALLQEPVPA
jgi:octaprenyl-diphosphate synthase